VQLRVALARLSQLVGHPLEAAALARKPEVPLPLRGDLPALLDQAAAVSPALAQYRALAQSQLAVVAQRKAERLPELQLRVEHQHGSFNTPGTPTGTVVSLAMASSFGAGLSGQSAIAEATARHEAALADLESQARDLSEQVMADHALLLQSEPRRLALRTAIDLSDTVRESWDRQYQAGRKTWQDLMSAAREQVQNEAQAADVEAAQLVASWRLALLTAGVDATLGPQTTTTPRESQR
jgi:adhesin transport system outer membrane protein